MYDIIIIGAGTAGMSAAIYGLRAGKTVLLIEEKSYGGQIINTPEVENYPGIKKVSGYEFAMDLYQQAVDFGAEIIYEKAEEIRSERDFKLVITNKNEYKSRSIIIATGAKSRPLNVDRERELIGAGVSYCATCDGAFFKGKDVAVVGGGSTALEDSGFLSNYCNKVYVIHRRDSFRGEDRLLKKLESKDNVQFVLDSVVTEIIGEQRVQGVTIKNVKDNSEKKIDIAGLFIAIGQMPDNKKFSDIINVDNKGYIEANETCRTSEEGVFTAGDCRTKNVRQLTTAASDGAISALAACEYIDLNEKN